MLDEHKVYLTDFARSEHNAVAKNKGSYPKINNNPKLREFVEMKIKNEKFSSDAALMAAVQNFGLTVDITTRTLYNSIDHGDLRIVRKIYYENSAESMARRSPETDIAQKTKVSTNIRSKLITRGIRAFGERSCCQQKSSNGAILTFTERLSRVEIITKPKSRE